MVGLQWPTAQSTTKAELVAAALAIKDVIICSNVTRELEFGTSLERVSLCTANTSALHVARN